MAIANATATQTGGRGLVRAMISVMIATQVMIASLTMRLRRYEFDSV